MTTPTTSPSRRPARAAEDERVFGLLLEHGPLAPATARHAVRPVLAGWGLDEDQVYDTLLVVSELVTNAITHALPPVVLHLHAATDGTGRVRVHVSDGGPRNAPTGWAAHRPADEHGRGESIITILADHTGTTDTTGTDDIGTLIDHWADLPAA